MCENAVAAARACAFSHCGNLRTSSSPPFEAQLSQPAAQGRGCASPIEAATAANCLCVEAQSQKFRLRQVSELRAANTAAAPESVARHQWWLHFGAPRSLTSTMSMFKRKKGAEPQFYATVADGLKKIYKGKLLPLEEVEPDIWMLTLENL